MWWIEPNDVCALLGEPSEAGPEGRASEPQSRRPRGRGSARAAPPCCSAPRLGDCEEALRIAEPRAARNARSARRSRTRTGMTTARSRRRSMCSGAMRRRGSSRARSCPRARRLLAARVRHVLHRARGLRRDRQRRRRPVRAGGADRIRAARARGRLGCSCAIAGSIATMRRRSHSTGSAPTVCPGSTSGSTD